MNMRMNPVLQVVNHFYKLSVPFFMPVVYHLRSKGTFLPRYTLTTMNSYVLFHRYHKEKICCFLKQIAPFHTSYGNLFRDTDSDTVDKWSDVKSQRPFKHFRPRSKPATRHFNVSESCVEKSVVGVSIQPESSNGDMQGSISPALRNSLTFQSEAEINDDLESSKEDMQGSVSPALRNSLTFQSETDINDDLETELSEKESSDLLDLPKPKPMKPSYNLAPYFSQSEVLQKLVALGVDLSAIEKVPEAADHIVQANWDRDIQPRLLFLHDIGILDSNLGHVLTKNPLLLKEDLDDMKVRINYFESKKFSREEICHIVTKAPLTLLLPVLKIDRKLGFLQQTFGLTGNEVRAVAVRGPKLIVWKLQNLKDIHFYMKEMLGFSDTEQKAMLLILPRLFLTDKYQMGKRFDFLHNVMGLSHEHLAAWPSVLRTRLHILKQRHRFLLSVGRAQYDPTKENYVSLKALVSGKDRDFCFHVAKASTTEYNNFLKTM